MRRYYSYSKLETYRQCKLKYYYKYVKKIPAPQNSIALMKGKYIHFKIEQDFKNNNSIEELLSNDIWNYGMNCKDELLKLGFTKQEMDAFILDKYEELVKEKEENTDD